MAIVTVHEFRLVFKLPLRQCEGFVNSYMLFTEFLLQVVEHIPRSNVNSSMLDNLKNRKHTNEQS